MRGGIVPWKRGSGGHGIRAAVSYALGGSCDASTANEAAQDAVIAASRYAGQTVTRHVVTDGKITRGELSVDQLQTWVDGHDPETGEIRGKTMHEANAALLYDATINTPKSYSLVAMLHPELAAELSKLMDRVRDQAIVKWQTELNARRGAGSTIREDLARIEVVELDHARSRSLDPHSHRHLWLNAKVQGQDGKWSNVDSKVLMQYQPIINGEGELAARTDPQWRATLDRFGLTLDADGEITEVAHLVRPFSKREAQIQANRAEREAWWRANNPGREPSAHHLASFDSWAWAKDRPNKPKDFDELDWATKVRSELMDLDQAAGNKLDHLFAEADHAAQTSVDQTVESAHVSIGELDRDLLALYATVWADNRSARSNDRFNHYTLRAGVAYAVAATNVVADRATLDELIEDVTARAVHDHTVTLTDAEHVPGHVKAFRSTATVQVKTELEALLRQVRDPGQRVGEKSIRQIDQTTNKHPLDARQCESAQLIAGTDRLVTITGPAGTGKTTMLKVAKKALDAQDRRMIVVAPSKKAAQVAGASVEAEAGSVHALLHSYGWRWTTDQAGEHWTRLTVGDLDPQTGRTYRGPVETFILHPGDRVVVDEAGMLDLYTARALLTIVDETGAGIAKVGDPRQLDPTGHGGAMALASRLADASTELSAVHRFRLADDTADAEYAALSLRLREPKDAADAAAIADELARRGQIVRADDDAAARGVIVDKWFAVHGKGKSIAITTTTNEQAQNINEAIQARRIDQGQLDTARAAYGQHRQAFYVGDRIQTRRNNRDADVANRDEFTILSISDDGRVVARREGDFNNDHVTLTPDYLASHAHLSYASTAHGIQGVTVDYAITAPGVTGAGLYVGMTRGVLENLVLSTASTPDAAIAEIAEAIRRGAVEDTLEQSRMQIDHEISVAAMPKTPTLTPEEQFAIDRLRTSLTDQLASVDHEIRVIDALRELATAGELNPWQADAAQRSAADQLHQAEGRRTDLDRLVADAERATTRATNNRIAETRNAVDHADQGVRDASPLARSKRQKDAEQTRADAQRQHTAAIPVEPTRAASAVWESWERAEIHSAVVRTRESFAERLRASSTELLAGTHEVDAATEARQAVIGAWRSRIDAGTPMLPRGVVAAESADLGRLETVRVDLDQHAEKMRADLDTLDALSVEEQARFATKVAGQPGYKGSRQSQTTARFEAESSAEQVRSVTVSRDGSNELI